MNQVTNSNKLYFNILKIPHILNFIDFYLLIINLKETSFLLLNYQKSLIDHYQLFF